MHTFLRTFDSIQQAASTSKKQIWIQKGYGIHWISDEMIKPKKRKRAKCLFWSVSASFDSQTLHDFLIGGKNHILQKSPHSPNMSSMSSSHVFFAARRRKIAWQPCRCLPWVRQCWNLDTDTIHGEYITIEYGHDRHTIPLSWGWPRALFPAGFLSLYIPEDKLNRHWPNLFRWMDQTQRK